MTYKEEIRELLADNPGLSGTQIAEEVGCSRQYACEVKRDLPTGDDDDDADKLGESDTTADLSDLDGGGGNVEDGEHDLEELEELVIADEWDEYECGECDATVEYLQDQCDECGNELAWWDA